MMPGMSIKKGAVVDAGSAKALTEATPVSVLGASAMHLACQPSSSHRQHCVDLAVTTSPVSRQLQLSPACVLPPSLT
jgi:hypothetical protein